jgi:Putative transposase
MFNQSVCALRFLYNVTLGRPHLIAHLPFAKRPRVLPTVFSPEDVPGAVHPSRGISNHRFVKLEAGRVTFRYKDYADDHRQKNMTLDAVEFLRRFVQHILPKGCMKLRHFGLLANGQRQPRLTQPTLATQAIHAGRLDENRRQ